MTPERAPIEFRFPGYKLQLFQELAKSGKKSFYEGCVAEVIIETVQRNGGLMDLEDLKSHVTDETWAITLLTIYMY
ncbi:unnamed protein product [Caretta caretta]